MEWHGGRTCVWGKFGWNVLIIFLSFMSNLNIFQYVHTAEFRNGQTGTRAGANQMLIV